MIRCKKALVLLVAACLACSGEPKEPHPKVATSSEPPTEVAITEPPLDACVLMLKADVDAAFAPRVFENGEKGRGDFAGTDTLAAVSGCTFTSPRTSVNETLTIGIVARRAPNDEGGVTVASAKAGAVKLNATPVDVSGLGDAAYWVNLGSSKRPIIELNVFKGRRLWLIFSATGSKLDADAALADLTDVAETTMGRL